MKKYILFTIFLSGCTIIIKTEIPEIQPEGVSNLKCGFANREYSFEVVAVDPDSDDVSVKMDFGDGNISGWSAYKPSGSSFIFTHTYLNAGIYKIYVKIRDIYGNESEWQKQGEFKVYDIEKDSFPQYNFAGLSNLFKLRIVDAGDEIITLYINWGDGKRDIISQYINNDFNLNHTYDFAGQYVIKIKIKDSKGDTTDWCELDTFFAHGYIIELEWDSTPSDLDAYLFLPTGDTIFFGNLGDLNNSPYAQLNEDVVEGYGPEIITISRLLSGKYTFAVNDFSGDGTITTSGAHVDVYYTDDLDNPVYQFDVPAVYSEPYWWWVVFEIDGATGQITELNYIQSGAPVKKKKFLTNRYCDYK